MISKLFHTCIIFLLTISTLLFSQTVIKTVPAPNYPYGLAWDGQHLWVGTSSTNDDKIWQVDPEDGTVVGSVDVPFDPGGSYTVKALGHDGTNLWVFMDLPSANHPDKFYKVDPVTGTVLKTLDSPENNYIGGMDIIDGDIWYTQYYASDEDGRDVVIRMDTSGVVLDTIVTEGEQPMGVATLGGFVWCAEDTGFGDTRQEIYEYDLTTGDYTGNFIRNPTASPRDMTHDGQYFWIVDYNTTNSLLYQFELGGDGTPQINVLSDEVNFGFVEVGSTESLFVNILNEGDAPLSITDIQFDNGLFSSDVASFPVVVDAGNSVVIGFTFSPTEYGTEMSDVTIFSDDPVSSEVEIELAGKGLWADPTILVPTDEYDFGDVWLPDEGVGSWNLPIHNQGIADLAIESLNTTGEVFSVSSPTVPFNVLPDDTMEVTVFFAPIDPVMYEGTLVIGSNDPAIPEQSISLQGVGELGPWDIGFEFWNYQIPDNPDLGYQEYRVEALKYIEDVSGDGIPDVITASENYWVVCLNGNSSGAAAEIWRYAGNGSIGSTNDVPHQQKALAISSDLNDDDYQDVVIGTGGADERVIALSGQDGSVIWEIDLDDDGDINSVETSTDFNGDQIPDVVVSGSGTKASAGRRSVYCLDGTNGDVLWTQFIGAFIRCSIPIGNTDHNGGIDVVTATGDGTSYPYAVVGIDSEGNNGLPQVIWEHTVGIGEGGGKELLRYDVDGETSDVIAGTFWGQLYRLDGATGEVVWDFDLGFSAVDEINLLQDITDDGYKEVLLTNFDDSFYVIDGATGEVVWDVFLGNFTWSAHAIPDITGDYVEDVLVACRNDNVYALDGTNGDILLEYPMNSGELQGATIVFPFPDLDKNNSWEILAAADNGKIVSLSGGTAVALAVDQGTNSELPTWYMLEQNYPNPFNPSTLIRYRLPVPAEVSLKVYDISGREVQELRNGLSGAGNHELTWDGTNSAGQPVASGVYIYRMTTDTGITTARKMILMK